MTGSISHNQVRSLFSLEREIEIDLLHTPSDFRATKRPQPAPPQLDLSVKDAIELSSVLQSQPLGLERPTSPPSFSP